MSGEPVPPATFAPPSPTPPAAAVAPPSNRVSVHAGWLVSGAVGLVLLGVVTGAVAAVGVRSSPCWGSRGTPLRMGSSG